MALVKIFTAVAFVSVMACVPGISEGDLLETYYSASLSCHSNGVVRNVLFGLYRMVCAATGVGRALVLQDSNDNDVEKTDTADEMQLTGEQCNYYLIPTRLDEMRTDETMIKMSNMKVVRVNKTLSMIKGTIDLMQDFPQDAICSVAGDQNVGGGPLNIPPTNCCEFFANDTTVWPPLRDALGFPMKCPIKEGTYELKGFHMNMCNLPDTLPPPKEGMMEVTVTMKDNKEMLHVKGYAEIKRSGLPMRR